MIFSTQLSCLVLLAAAACGESKHDISLVVMAPGLTEDPELTVGWAPGPALIPAAILAAKEINNSTEVLPGFNLHLTVANSGCSITTEATISVVRDIYENKDRNVVGIIGPGCSAAALAVSSLTIKRQISLIHITPSATTPELGDNMRFNTFATISSALSYVQSFLELMRHNNWNRIATLQDIGRDYFTQTHTGFKESVDSRKVIYTGSLFSGGEGAESFIPLDNLRSSQARVVMVFAGSKVAAQLLCYAYHKAMLYPNFMWVFHDRTEGDLVTAVDEFHVDQMTLNCTMEDMIVATEGVILNQFHLVQEDRDETLPFVNKTYTEYEEDYKVEFDTYQDMHNMTSTPNNYSNSYHDAVWAMAIALHNAAQNGVDLTSYTYNRSNDTKEIAKHLDRVNFKGVSGPIAFQNRSARTIIFISQIQGGNDVHIGTFDRTRTNETFIVEKGDFIQDTYAESHTKVHAVLGVFIIVFTTVLIVLTFLLQLANTFWYSYHSIKATSPNITNLVFSGCYLFSIALLILSIQETFVFPDHINPTLYAVLCNMFTWCFLIGYSLIFGTICVKIWRVYRLFKHFRNESPGCLLSDNSLVFLVILLILVDVVICLTWNIVDPWITEVTMTPSVSGDPTVSIRSECRCRHLTIWLIAVTLYKGTVLLLLVVLSILNRRIKRKDFQHTRKINILIYSVTMLAGIGIPIYFLLAHLSIYIGYVILSAILLTTIILSGVTLFLPPVLPVLKLKISGVDDEQPRRKSVLSFHQTMTPRSSISVY